MADNDMKHMNYLDAIARHDIQELRRKESTYKGSWKRRGGVGAFMMLARKWDRLEGMLQPMYDIFEIIRGQSATDIVESREIGSDGTVLAEVRDLRRYLTLVEAEMMARGIVETRSIVVEPKTSAARVGESENALVRHEMLARQLDPNFDAVIAGGMVHERTSTGTRSRPATDRDRARAAGHCGHDGEPIVFGDPVTCESPTGVVNAHLVRLDNNSRPVVRFESTGHETTTDWGRLRLDPTRTGLYRERRVSIHEKETTTRHRVGDVEKVERSYGEPAGAGPTQRTPEDGGQHAALAPHVVTPGFALRKNIEPPLFEAFWNRRGGDTYVLEPRVNSARIPPLLRPLYHSRGEGWTLRPELIPADARDFFPFLHREHNMKEHEEMPEWQRALFQWNDNGSKYELSEPNVAWAVQS